MIPGSICEDCFDEPAVALYGVEWGEAGLCRACAEKRGWLTRDGNTEHVTLRRVRIGE